MSLTKPNSLETALDSILTEHFENAQNPHETIYRIWLLRNAGSIAGAPSIAAMESPKIDKLKYN